MSYILPGDPIPKKDPYAKSDAAFSEAQAARHARRSRDKQLAWDKAAQQLKVWTPSMAVEAMSGMPGGLQQMYCLIEELGENREAVLRFFPAVGTATREAWAGFSVAPKKTSRANQRKT
jgi:hypothetical protein